MYTTQPAACLNHQRMGEVLSDEIIGCLFQKLRWVPSSISSRLIQTALHCVVCDGAPFVLVTSHRVAALFGNNRLFRPSTD